MEVKEQLLFYFGFAAAGGFAGLLHILRSRRKRTLASIVTSIMIGMMLTWMFIGFKYGSSVSLQNFWECIAYSFGIGFFQTLALGRLETVIRGVPLEHYDE